MNHPEVIRLCRELLRAVDQPSHGTRMWNDRAQRTADQLKVALGQPDPVCGALLLNAEVNGRKRAVLVCQRPESHQGDHGVPVTEEQRRSGDWFSWPRASPPPDATVRVAVKP